jgi:transcriptional regulator GlxA family with amidase domain
MAHDQGALLCSAWSGIFLFAAMGLVDGKDPTGYFGDIKTFAATYPASPSTRSGCS